MKCPNPLCDNAALEDSHAFCFKCGLKLKGRATSNDTGRDVSSDDENPTPNQDLSSDSGETADEGQRKRKGEEHEQKPAKRQSFEIEEAKAHRDSPLDAELADDATSALQNLALKSKLQDRQELPSGATHSNIPPTDPRNSSTGIHLGDTCVSERVPGDEKQGNKEKQEVSICTTKMMLSTDQDKDQSTSTKDTLPGKTTDERRHSNKTIIHAGNQSLEEPQPPSSSQSPSTDTVHADKATGDEKLKHGTESDEVCETYQQICEVMETENNCNSTCSQSQTVEDILDVDEGTEEKDESDEELEENVPVDENRGNKTADQKGNESKSQRDRRKKKERKKKAVAAKAKAKEGKNDAVQIQNQGHDTGNSGEDCSQTTLKDKKGSKNHAKGINKADQEQTMAKKRNSQGYFANDNRESMTVVFHAVLAPYFKFEKTKGDKVVMRFGGPAFGHFGEDIIEMQLENMSLRDEFLLLKGTLQVPVVLVRERVFYKYVVRKAREQKQKDIYLWEQIDNIPYKNRCLTIPKGRCQAGTTWHQYDDAILGEKGLLQSFLNMIWRNTDAAEGRTIATLAMLPRWEGFWVGKSHRDMTAWEAIEEVKDVAYCMTQSYGECNRVVRQCVPRGYVFDKILKDYLAPKIKENTKLQSVTEEAGKRILLLVSSVTIAHVLNEHKVSLDEDDYGNLFQSLILWSEPKEQRCTAFEELLKHFSGEHLRTLGESIQALCRQVIRQCHDLHAWLFAVPLVHFLTQQSKPFSDSSLLMEMPKGKDESWWGSEGFQTRTVRDRSFVEQRSPCSMMNMLLPLFELDPLFRRTFLLVVPCREFGKVATSGKFPPVEVYTSLARILSEKQHILEEERQAIATTLEKTQKTFQAASPDGIIESFSDNQVAFTQETLLSCTTACRQILNAVAGRCDFDLLSGCLCSIQMWTAALDRETAVEKGGRKWSDFLRNVVEETLRVVKKWLRSDLHRQMPCYNKNLAQKEFQVWSRLLAMCWGSEECQQIWRTHLLEALRLRLEECACNDLVELLTKTNLSEFHDSVQDLVSESTYKKVESMLERGAEGEEVFINLSGRGLDSPQASKCGDLLTLMLTRCWPVGSGGVQPSGLAVLRHVLTWRLWPCFFQRFGPASDYRRVLKPDGRELLLQAISSLEAASYSLKQGTIEFQVLNLLRDHSANFLTLVDHIIDEDGKKSPLRHVLGWRFDELRAFLEEREQVDTFIRMCSLIKRVDLVDLSQKATLDASRRLINELAQSEINGGKCVPRVTFFGLTQTQKEMIYTLDRIRDSVLLRRLWEKSGAKALSAIANFQPPQESLSIEDVEELVWKPSITNLRTLEDQFVAGSISFKDVDRHFNIFTGKKRYDDLAREMKVITSKNASRHKCLEPTIENRIAQVQQYHMLQHCIDTAGVIWNFKTALQLEGDFRLVDDLRNQLNDVFKERPLRSMGPALVQTGRILSNITPKRARCLDAVASCQHFITWLRNAVGGPQELKVLVDLISAGETDMETARVTCLHTSCLGFAPLIFDLKPTFGFDELMTTCEPVWNAVDSDPSLPEKLIDTSRQLEWLKGVKDSHGSVAVSSLMEAETINELGVYRLGCLDPLESDAALAGKTLDCVVHLSVPVRGQDENKNYALNDLKDLQSKLMLIAAKASQGKGEVDRFVEIFQGVLRVAKVYIALCEAGEVSHLSWTKEFHCSPKLVTRSLTEDLNDQGDKMEQCLQEWKKEMHIKRLRYNNLNYFTTQQLLFLRNKLASVRDRGPDSADGIPLEVYNLLESVLSGLEPGALKAALVSSGICCRPVGTDFTRSFGASRVCDAESSMSRQSRSCGVKYPSGLLSVEEQTFQLLVAKLDLIGLSEEVALAALMSCGDVSEAKLLLWCVQNGKNEALVSAKYTEALSDPRYAQLVVRDAYSTTEQESRGSDEVVMAELEASAEPMEYTFTLDQTAGGKYLSLDELGCLLMHLSSQGPKKQRRLFPRYLKRGKPNLVVVPKGDVLGTVLSLYMHDGSRNLPTSEEVLICQTDTTAEEVELFWRRSLGDKEGRLFCLVNADILDYSVSQKAADALEFLLQEPQYNRNEGLSLMVICSSENEDRAHIVAALDQYRLTTAPRCAFPKEIRGYFKEQFKSCGHDQGRFRGRTFPRTAAAELDKEKLSVRVVISETAGTGKSLVVRRLSERLHDLHNNDVVTRYLREMGSDLPLCISVPVYGPAVNQSAIVDTLLPHLIAPDLPLSRIFHIDVHPSATDGLDTFLFNLLVLGVLTSTSGQVWRRRSCDLFVIEITSPSNDRAAGIVRRNLAPRFPGYKSASRKASSEPFHKLLPTIHCGTPRQTLFQLKNQQTADTSLNPLFDDAEFRSTYVQRAFQYLKLWGAGQSLDDFWFVPGQVMGDHAECLETLMRHCGIQDPSWAEVRHFVNFLNSQLRSCEESSFCDTRLVGDTLEGFRTFVVRFMVLMSRDFATPSLTADSNTTRTLNKRVDDDDDDDADVGDTGLEIRQLRIRRRWETSSHPYIFFNYDHMTMTFVGFHIDQNGNLIDPDRRVIIEPNLMSRHLRTGLFVQRVDMETNYESWSKGEKIEKLCAVMGVEWPYDPDDSYELTTDNLKKILAIHMRFRCGIPVVIMGETGCGKTRLIRYMCGLQSGPGGPKNMLLMKVHGGTSWDDIRKKVEQAEEVARENEPRGIDTVLFFDEANTTDALGMIKEVMVDRRVNGRQIGVGLRRLQFIAACNPYRKHTEEMIVKLESAGLGYLVKTRDTRHRIGRIPLRHLVYRVHALPESMRPLVWDFGQLKPEIEELYTRQIVGRFILQEKKLPGDQLLVKAVTAVLTASQLYMRDQTDECSFVSLRDVERAMNVMVWFYNHLHILKAMMDETDKNEEGSDEEDDEEEEDDFFDAEDEEGLQLDKPLDDVTLALVLSLGVCYQARLQNREPYRMAVAQSFVDPCKLLGGHKRILHEITRCQRAVLSELELGPNIARNTALSENVFMMVVCIELRIPLFVVGKPGSSKSLAKTVVARNMEGDASRSRLFKTFKQVHMVSYQCSPLSTADGIVTTFNHCSKLQEGKNLEKFVSVVVLDEVGLAEDSPLMPLKTLHPLLEDGVMSTDDIIEVEKKTSERVAFIGISNWALDPAKMNRGIMLSRDLPNKRELVDSAMGICSTDPRIQSLVAPLINSLAQGYSDLYEKQQQSKALQESKKDEFFGLRDFYSLVKMVYRMAEEARREPRWFEVEHAIRRNFGGLDELDPVKIFKKHFSSLGSRLEAGGQSEENFLAVDLIKASLERRNTRGESRYLLVLTENYAALPVVQQELLREKDEPVVIFGSSFPKDQEYTQICRNINRIKVCMEAGRTVILLNLESLYESLYDALNQYYMMFGGQKFVDLGLGSHRVKCRVHDDFRLIVIADRDVVYSKFPIPLINRLEKHYLVTSASLDSHQQRVVKALEEWVAKFADVQAPRHQHRRAYSAGDAFVGYHGNTAASVVLQVCNNLVQNQQRIELSLEEAWEEEVFRDSQELLLRCATPDAVARLPCTRLANQADDLWAKYFTVQEHSSLTAFLRNVLTTEERREHEGLLIQVTTHSRLLSSNDLVEIAKATLLPLSNITCLSLQQFHTEQQFCFSVRDFFGKLGGTEGLLLVQCDSGDVNSNLIACARHLLVDQRSIAEEDFSESFGRDSLSFVHIALIVQLPRRVGGCTTFAGFQGGSWLSFHIDELHPPSGQIPAVEFMVDRSVSELFDASPQPVSNDAMDLEEEGADSEMETSSSPQVNFVTDKVDVGNVLRSCVQAAVSRIDDESSGSLRSARQIELMLKLLPEGAAEQPDLSFATVLARRIHELLKEKDKRAGDTASDWLRSEALSGTGIQENGTFRKALWQRIYASVTPILSEVIASIDRDSNLELVGEDGSWVARVWLSLFQRPSIVELHYDNFLPLESAIIRERVPLITSGRDRHSFESQFPFSWLIKKRIDAMWRDACSVSANSRTPVLQCLQDAVSHSDIGAVLEDIRSENYEEAAVLRYLHDFVHMVHKPTVSREEELVGRAIATAAREFHMESNSEEEFSLSISLVHVVYNRIEKRLGYFCKLVQAQPDIVPRLLQVIPADDSEMVLDAVALQLCLALLEPSEQEFDDPETRQIWCSRVLSIRPSADTMIRDHAQVGGGPKTSRILRHCRSVWQRVSAVRLFIEHTCPGTSVYHPADIKNVFKLWKALGDETDFSTPQTMQVIEKFLVDCREAVSKRYTSYGISSCPICFEGPPGKDPVKVPCGHVICLVCISEWIARERRCPVCKQTIPENFKLVSTKTIRKAVEEHVDFRKRCNSFFMELVSMFCFGSMSGGHSMDPELFAMFMGYVINARSQTKNFSPFPEHGVDATPVVRSFLLQQLLRTGDEEVRCHMVNYLSEVRGLTPEIDDMLQVCQLFVHCKEDALISQYSDASGSLLVMIILARTLCEEAMPYLTSSSLKPSRELDVTVLESVAKARYALTLTSKFMLSSIEDREGQWADIQVKNELSSLVEAAKRMCYKTLSPVPRLYLLKMLVRKFGIDSIHKLCNRKEFEWIVPPESRDKQQEDLVPDKFVIYGDPYRDIREAMAQAVLSRTRKELTKVLQNAVLAPLARDVIVLLSEYREVTTCYSFTSEQRRLSAKAHQCIGEFLQDNQYLSAKARPLALQLLDNTQGAAYPALRVAPGRSTLEQSLGEIVVHTSAVLQCINQGTICEPLRLMVENPAAMRMRLLPVPVPHGNISNSSYSQNDLNAFIISIDSKINCFLPSMPDDNLEEAMAGIKESGTWYQCPKGHPYYIGDCGRPVEIKVCPECKVHIGGHGYALSQGNTTAQRGDRTMKGHVLGHPSTRPKVLAPERTLSSVVVATVRVLLHSAMLGGASSRPHDVSSLVHPNVPIEALGRFLWDHLQFDVEALARGLGRSVDDAVLCVHMVLAQLTTHASQQPQERNIASDLNSKAARRDWEAAFTAAIVAPVLANLEDKIQQSLKLLVSDKRLGNNPLMRQLYEVDLSSENLTETVPPTCPALWRYRTQVTIEHVSHTFQQEVTSSNPKKNKVLGEFLRQEHTLRAVRFLPDIVRLQRLLMDKFHRRIDRKEAEEMSLHKFFTNISSKAEREELKSLTVSFKSAWNMVRLNLDQQGRLRPPSDLCEMSITNKSPVAVLLPSTSGMAICSTALVYYLTSVHNEFNQRYQNLAGGKVKDLAHVPMKDVTTSGLIAYHPERDLVPLILAQCNYSLEVGQGTVVQYNWDALERQLIDRFIRARPLIDFEDERFAFSRDVQLDSVFASVRTKIPQVPLHAATSRQIVDEFRSLSDICDVLSLLDIAIGFLSSAGGSPELHLGQYLRRVLRMPQENSLRSSKAQQCCQLRHLMSLWRLLTLERARILIKRGEDPFEQISDTYKQAMSPKLMMSFSSVMRRIDLDRFVCEVLELIVLNLKGDVTPGEEDMSLGDYVQWHLDNKGSEPVTGLEELPSTVLLKHVINAWRVSVELCDSYHDKRDSAAS